MAWARELLLLQESEQLVHLDGNVSRVRPDLLAQDAVVSSLLVAALVFLLAILASKSFLLVPAQA